MPIQQLNPNTQSPLISIVILKLFIRRIIISIRSNQEPSRHVIESTLPESHGCVASFHPQPGHLHAQEDNADVSWVECFADDEDQYFAFLW
jgi:hypothetical protein